MWCSNIRFLLPSEWRREHGNHRTRCYPPKTSWKGVTASQRKSRKSRYFKICLFSQHEPWNPYPSQCYYRICRGIRQCNYRRGKGPISRNHKNECRPPDATGQRHSRYVKNRSRNIGICADNSWRQSVTFRFTTTFSNESRWRRRKYTNYSGIIPFFLHDSNRSEPSGASAFKLCRQRH